MTGFRSTVIKVVTFSLIGAVLFVMLYNTMSNVVEGKAHVWRANFTSASGLRSGDDVRVAGVKVGRVESVEVTPEYQARVTFQLVDDQKIYASTLLKLRYQNLLGQRYLALTAGADRGQQLSPDTIIGAGMTDPGFDLTALLNGFKPLFDTLDPAEVNTFAQNIIDVLQGQGPAVDSLLKSTASSAKFLSQRDHAFTEVLDNLTPVLKNIAGQSDELDATVDQLTRMMSGLARERGTFARSVDTLGGLTGTTADLAHSIRPDVRTDVRALRQTSDTLARNRGRVIGGAAALGDVLGNLAQDASSYSAINAYFCNFGLSVTTVEGLPPAPTVWIGGPDGPYSAVCRAG